MAAISTKGSPTTTGWSRRPAPADEQLQLPRSSPSEIQVVSDTTGMDSQGAVRSGAEAPKLLSIADVSRALGVAEITVARLIRSGELARIKILAEQRVVGSPIAPAQLGRTSTSSATTRTSSASATVRSIGSMPGASVSGTSRTASGATRSYSLTV